VDAGAIQDLVGVDVADARDGGLVEQDRLDGGAGMPGERLPQRGGREVIVERVRAEPGQERVGPARVRAGRADPAEPPRVVVIQAERRLEPEDGPGGRVRHRPQHARGGMAARERGGAIGGQDELAGHFRVDEQAAGIPTSLAGLAEEQDQDLAAACHPADLVIHYVLLDRVARSVEDLAVQDLERRDAHAGDVRGQAAAQHLHLG